MRLLANGEHASASEQAINLETRLYWHFGEFFGDANFRLFQHNRWKVAVSVGSVT